MDPPPFNPPVVAYQHWLDDAANMGLMLYRMRQDSKRERLIQPRVHTRPPPVHHPDPPPPLPTPNARSRDTTPRTDRALQTPTVATRNTSHSHPSPSNSFPSPVARPPAFYLPLD